MKRAVLVNGVPASGKSTVAASLVEYLTREGVAAVPLSLDRVKEGLYHHIGTGNREHNRMLGRASYQSIFESIAAFPEMLVPVIDAWHGFQPRAVLEEHLLRAEIIGTVEVWCKVTPDSAAARYRARASTRHPGHLPASYANELFDLAARAEPFGFGKVVIIDTERPIPEGAFAEILNHLVSDDNGG